jgi:putative DNA primase/helicase
MDAANRFKISKSEWENVRALYDDAVTTLANRATAVAVMEPEPGILHAETETVVLDVFAEPTEAEKLEFQKNIKIEKLENEVELSHAEEDRAKEVAIKATDRAIDAEFQAAKLRVENCLLKRNMRMVADKDVERYDRYFQELEEAKKNWKLPRPVDTGLIPVPKFRPDFLPQSILPWVQDVSERMSVPLDFAGVCALVTLSGVIGRRVFVFPKAKDKEWKEPICLSGAVIASSGQMKTPTWKTFTNVVVEVEMDWRKEQQQAYAEYLAKKKEYDQVQKQNKSNVAKGNDEQRVVSMPPKPQMRRIMLNDATPEAMHQVMEDNPEGVFYYRDELSSWVKELDKKGYEVQRGLFLAAMNGNDAYAIDRIERGTVHAIMCATVFGGFQPKMFQDFLNNSTNIADGTIPRFPFLIWPDEQGETETIDRTANDGAKQVFRAVVRRLATMKAERIAMHFSPEAQAKFNEWFEKLKIRIAREPNPGKQSHLSKYKGALPRIAGLLQIVDNVVLGDLADHAYFIDADHLQKAIRLLEYLEQHMHRVYGCILTPVQVAEQVIAEHIQDGSLTAMFTTRDIHRKQWRGIKYADAIDMALENLQDKNWVRKVEPEPWLPGRPTMKWEVNPRVVVEMN